DTQHGADHEEDTAVDGARGLTDIKDAGSEDGACGGDGCGLDGYETEKYDGNHDAGNTQRAMGQAGIGQLGRGPFEEENVPIVTEVLHLRPLAEDEQHVTRFEADIVQQRADHAAAALDAEHDASGLVTKGDLLDGLA